MQTLLRWAGSERLAPWMAFGLSLLLFANTVPHGHNLDDNLVTKGHRLTSKGLVAIGEIFTSPYYEDGMGYSYEYRPVTLASFAIEHGIFGERAPVSHLINVLLFALTALLVTRVAFLLAPDGMVLLPALTGLLFVLHPMHVEVVASIKNRDELLALLLAMGAVRASFSMKGSLWSLVLVPLLMMASVLSKSSAFTFFLLIPIIAVVRGESSLRLIVLAVMLSLAFILLIIFKNWPLIWGGYLFFTLITLTLFSEVNKKVGIQNAKVVADRLVSVQWPRLVAGHERQGWSAWYGLIPAAMGLFLSMFFWRAEPIIVAASLMVATPYWTGRYQKSQLIGLIALFLASTLLVPIGASAYLLVLWLVVIRPLTPIGPLVFRIQILLLVLAHMTSSFVIADNVITPLVVLLTYVVLYYLQRTARLRHRYRLMIWTVVSLGHLMVMVYDLSYENILIALWIGAAAIHTGKSSGRFARLLGIGLPCFFISSMVLNNVQPPEPYSLWRDVIEPVEQAEEPVEIIEQNLMQGSTVIESAIGGRPLTLVEFPLGQEASMDMRLGTASAIMGHYLKMMFIPWPQAFYYGFDEVPVVETNDLRSILSAVAHLMLLVLALFCLRSHPILSFGIIAYLSSMFLFSNMLSPVAGMIGDRLTHVASFGFCLSLAYVLDRALSFNLMTRRLVTAAIMVLAIGWSGMTLARNSHWKDEVTLMRRDIVHVPNSANANYLLGVNLLAESFRQKNPSKAAPLQKEAIHHMKRAAGIFPGYINFWHDLGRAYRDIGDLRSALPCFKEAHRLDSTFYDATLHVAMIAEELGNEATAIEYYERCIRFNPGEPQAYTNLSFLYFNKKRYQESIGVNERAIAKNPLWRDPYENIARAYVMLDEPRKAGEYMKRFRSLP